MRVTRLNRGSGGSESGGARTNRKIHPTAINSADSDHFLASFGFLDSAMRGEPSSQQTGRHRTMSEWWQGQAAMATNSVLGRLER